MKGLRGEDRLDPVAVRAAADPRGADVARQHPELVGARRPRDADAVASGVGGRVAEGLAAGAGVRDDRHPGVDALLLRAQRDGCREAARW